MVALPSLLEYEIVSALLKSLQVPFQHRDVRHKDLESKLISYAGQSYFNRSPGKRVTV